MFKYTTLKWIYFWGVMIIMLAWLKEQTQDSWTFYIVIASFIILIGGLLFTLIKSGYRKAKLRNPFDVYYETTEDVPQYEITVNAVNDPQELSVTLQINTDVIVEHISAEFKGNGQPPRIDKLYDWGIGAWQKRMNMDVHREKHGVWFCDFCPPLRRYPKSKIKLGIQYVPSKSFDGKLEIGFTAIDIAKTKSLPFKVRDI